MPDPMDILKFLVSLFALAVSLMRDIRVRDAFHKLYSKLVRGRSQSQVPYYHFPDDPMNFYRIRTTK